MTTRGISCDTYGRTGWLALSLLVAACSVSQDGLALTPATTAQGGANGRDEGEGGAGGAAKGDDGDRDDDDSPPGEGGASPPMAGGTSGEAGAAGNGGAGAAGGAAGKGGMGGAAGAGGTAGTGGAAGSVGTAGTGGSAGAGGAAGTGGAPGTGGMAGTGGAGGSAPYRSPCEEARGELIACFAFDGTVEDGSKNKLEARANDPQFVDGAEGKALRVGPGRVVRVAPNRELDLEVFTIETLVRLDRLPTPGARMGLVDSDQRYGLFVLPGGDLLCNTSGATVVARGAIKPGTWHRVTCSRSATAAALFVDGKQLVNEPGVRLPVVLYPKELIIGGNEPSGDEMEGFVDATRIWRTARGLDR